MAVGSVAAWWLMGIPGLIGWIAGAWGGMSAATPFEADEDDTTETAGPDDWDQPAGAVAWCDGSRTEAGRRPAQRGGPLAATPLCCSA
jgi:hypothetical protein